MIFIFLRTNVQVDNSHLSIIILDVLINQKNSRAWIGSLDGIKMRCSPSRISEYNRTYSYFEENQDLLKFDVLILPSVAVNGPSRGLASILHHNGREPLLRLLREVAVRQAQGEEQDQVRQAVHHLLAQGLPFNFSV
jgi:hypothetical protein